MTTVKSHSDRKLLLRNPADPGKAILIEKWLGYTFNDRLFGASNFACQLPATKANRALVKEVKGWDFEITADGSQQFVGLVDEKDEDTSKSNTDLHISGRDYTGLLMDSVIPPDLCGIFNQTLESLTKKWTHDLWPTKIFGVVTNAAASRYVAAGASSSTKSTKKTIESVSPNGDIIIVEKTVRTKRRYKPFGRKSPDYLGTGTERITQGKVPFGETIFNALQDLSAQIGSHVRMANDGGVIIARPCYDFDVSGYGEGIVLKWNATENRATYSSGVIGVNYGTSIAGRKSQYHVTGFGKSKKKSRSNILSGGVIKDPGPAFWEKTATPPYLGAELLYKPGKISPPGQRAR